MESLQKIVITTGDQHFDGFKHNCSHKKHISTWKLLSVKCLRELRQAKVTNSFMRKTSYHKKISVFTFLDVNLVLYVQSDFHIPLHLCSHEKKIFSGLIVKNSAVSMHGLKIFSCMLCGTTKLTGIFI